MCNLTVTRECDADFEGIAPVLWFGQSARDAAQHAIRRQAVARRHALEPGMQGFISLRRWAQGPRRQSGTHAAADRNRSWCLASATGSICSLPSRIAASAARASRAVTLPVIPPLSSSRVRIIATSPKGEGLRRGSRRP